MHAIARLQCFGIIVWTLGSVAHASAEDAASVNGPGSAVSGATIVVTWTAPKGGYDKIGIVAAGAPDKQRPLKSQYARKSPTRINVPEPVGNYEIRYIQGKGDATLAKTALTVTPASATVQGPGTAVSGATIAVSWTGPENEFDKIVIVEAGAPEKANALESEYVRKSPTQIKVPEPVGEYEIRYLTGESGSTLATTRITVTPTSASIEGPITAEAGAPFKVIWTGPANELDRIAAFAKSAPDDRWAASGYVKKGKPLELRAPLTVGEYELRYLTGDSHSVLARAKLDVTPAKLEPGKIEVSLSEHSPGAGRAGSGGAIEILLDASGSMLKRIGSQRRIDIAVDTLKKLTTSVIPGGTPFALRVFGQKAASCETELTIPLRPLDAAAVGKQVAALEPKLNARTPIAASIEAVAADLRAAKGERLVVLVTDGEETCGGNPVAAIQKLRRAEATVRINIVGFAIDDANLAKTFKLWSEQGGGAYFEARDAAGLNQALSQAMRPAFEVLDSRKQVVAGGFVGDGPVEVMPGTYTVKLKAGTGGSQSVTVRAKETGAVRF